LRTATQLTAVLPNRRGALADLCNVLHEAGVSVLALCLMDTAEFGLARFVAYDADAARTALDEAGIPCAPAQVLLIAAKSARAGTGTGSRRPVGPRSGSCTRNSLAGVLETLAIAKVEVSYVYSGSSSDTAKLVTVIGCPDPDRALDLINVSKPPIGEPPT